MGTALAPPNAVARSLHPDSARGAGQGCYGRDRSPTDLGPLCHLRSPSWPLWGGAGPAPFRGKEPRGAGLGAGATGAAPEHGLLSPAALHPVGGGRGAAVTKAANK